VVDDQLDDAAGGRGGGAGERVAVDTHRSTVALLAQV
jgi:hypothetical protein